MSTLTLRSPLTGRPVAILDETTGKNDLDPAWEALGAVYKRARLAEEAKKRTQETADAREVPTAN